MCAMQLLFSKACLRSGFLASHALDSTTRDLCNGHACGSSSAHHHSSRCISASTTYAGNATKGSWPRRAGPRERKALGMCYGGVVEPQTLASFRAAVSRQTRSICNSHAREQSYRGMLAMFHHSAVLPRRLCKVARTSAARPSPPMISTLADDSLQIGTARLLDAQRTVDLRNCVVLGISGSALLSRFSAMQLNSQKQTFCQACPT